jgi:c-di-GMP-binding flagellar brake protein YcgR
VEQLRDADSPPVQQERSFERIGNSLLVSYSVGDEFAPEFTEAYDIALGGLAMLTNAQLPSESVISVTLELHGDSRPVLRLRGTVRWSQYNASIDRYRTGVAFVNVDEELRAHLRRYIDTLYLLRDMDML